MDRVIYHGNSALNAPWPGGSTYTPSVNLLTRSLWIPAGDFIPSYGSGQDNPATHSAAYPVGQNQFSRTLIFPEPFSGGAWAQAMHPTDPVADTTIVPSFQLYWACLDTTQNGNTVGWELHWTAHAAGQIFSGGGPGSSLIDTVIIGAGPLPTIQITPSTAVAVTGANPWTTSTLMTFNVYRGINPADSCTSSVHLIGLKMTYRALA